MTALEAEILRVLDSEASYPPMSTGSLWKVLFATGWSPLPSEQELGKVLDGLAKTNWIESVSSPRLGRRFRILLRGAKAS